MSMKPRNLPPVDRVRDLLEYDPTSGKIRWITSRGNLVAGSEAGGVGPDGYSRVKIDGATYLTHRIVWLLVTGRQPDEYIDHIDRNRSNNSWSNLRQATKSENHQNSSLYKNNKVGLTGVCRKGGRFKAYIWANKKSINLGVYDTPNEAYAAYLSAKAKLHTFQPTVSR